MNIEPEDKRLTIGFQKGQKGKQDDKENQEEHHTRRCDEGKDAQKAESNLGQTMRIDKFGNSATQQPLQVKQVEDETSIVDYDQDEEEEMLTMRGSEHARSSAAAIDLVKVIRNKQGLISKDELEESQTDLSQTQENIPSVHIDQSDDNIVVEDVI